MAAEIRPISDFSNYSTSCDGHILNNKSEKTVKSSIKNSGYMQVKNTRKTGAGSSRSKSITCIRKDFSSIKTYCNAGDASNNTGICRHEIYNICYGKKASTGEFYWWYTDDIIMALLIFCTSENKKALFSSPAIEYLIYHRQYEFILRILQEGNEDDEDFMSQVKKN